MIVFQDFDAINNVLAEIGFGKAHILILITCGFFNMYLLTETMGIAVISSAAMCDLKLSPFNRSLLRSACLAGLALGAYFMGYLSDQYGRRKILLCSIPPCLILSTASMLVNVWEALCIMRIFVGIFLGGVSSTQMAYLGEFCMNERCLTRTVSLMAMFAGLGMIYIPAMGTIILNQSIITISNWRLLGILYTLPGVVAFSLLLLLPESPRYLFAAGRYTETIDVLLWLSLKNRGQPLKEIEITDLKNVINDKEVDNSTCVFCDVIPLFKRPLVQKLLGNFLIHFLVVCITRGLGLWFSELRMQSGRFKGDHAVCEEIVTFLEHENESGEKEVCYFPNQFDSIMLGIVFVVGYLKITFLLRFINPKILFVTCLMISSLFGFALVWIPNSVAIEICFILFMGFSSIVLNLLGSNIVAFVPTHLRGRAMGLCDASGRIGAIIGCNMLGLFLRYYCILVLNFFASCPLVAAILGCFLPF